MKERFVFCKKYQKELVGLDAPPYPGPKGHEIYESISRRAWEEWIDHQTMLINEGHINLTDKSSRKWLIEQMDLFFLNSDYEIPKGYRKKE